jgi:hypothetical protein
MGEVLITPFTEDELDADHRFDLASLVDASQHIYEDPVTLFIDMAGKVPDDDLLAFVGLVRKIEDVVDDHSFFSNRGPVCNLKLLIPDFSRAVRGDNGQFLVPVADRDSLKRYLEMSDVEDALSAYDTDFEDSSDEIEGGRRIIRQGAFSDKKIEELPESYQPLDRLVLYAFSGAYYWSVGGEDKYVSPSNTLEKIAGDIPSDQLIPLLLCLEKNFPKIVDDDGCYMPVNPLAETSSFYLADGIIWQVYDPMRIRHALIDACSEDLGRGYLCGIDESEFDSDYLLQLSGVDYDPATSTDLSDRVTSEENRRHRKRDGWLFKDRDISVN